MDESENETRNTVRSNNDTVNQTDRSVKRTCTQKFTITILEKYDTTNVRLWWRRFVQYAKMTKDIDLNMMTTSREIKYEFRERLEEEVKDIHLGSRTFSSNGDYTGKM